MAFNKQYENRKDWRRPYLHSARFDKSCRPHGGCPYCLRGRLYSYLKRKSKALYEQAAIKDFVKINNTIDIENLES